MKYKLLLTASLLLTSLTAHSEWFLRGTHNGWGTTQMDNASIPEMKVLKGVILPTAGYIKFDRFGDWFENYGLGGSYGANIPVAAGTWDITFYTNTKQWEVSRARQYHLRGNFNQWKEGTLLKQVGISHIYEYCHNHNSGFGSGGLQFKVDPYGGWGGDENPASNFVVTKSGWVKITYNSDTNKVTAKTNLTPHCEQDVSVAEATVIPVYQAAMCHQLVRSSAWINSNEELNAFLTTSGKNTIPFFSPPNFSTHKLLVVYSGEKPSTGYSMGLASQKYSQATNKWEIQISESTPSPDSVQAQVITSPCLMLRIPRAPTEDVDIRNTNDKDFISTTPAWF